MSNFNQESVLSVHHWTDTLYLVGTGTGLAPFLSVIKDPETYERFEKMVLQHGCGPGRQN